MGKKFKLYGNAEAKLVQLERILPRITRRLATKTFAIIPASMVHAYVKEVDPNEIIFKAVMFKGKVKKAIFKIGSLTGKGMPEYVCRINGRTTQNKFMAKTKKLLHVMEFDLSVEEGDVVEISMAGKDVVIHDVFITVLIQLNKDLNEIKEFLLDELESTRKEDERI
jgi:hypothetical protein